MTVLGADGSVMVTRRRMLIINVNPGNALKFAVLPAPPLPASSRTQPAVAMIDARQGLIHLSRRMSVQLLPASTEARPGEKLPFALVNEGPGHISFGTPYTLERDVDGAWTPCTVGTAWTAQLITLRPGGRHEGVANIPQDAPPGRYRVTKQFERRDSGGKDVVAFELDVVET